MKLHLPLSLRSALLAVLASFSFAQGGETIIVEKKDNGEGTSLEAKPYEDLTIIINEGGILRVVPHSSISGENYFTINKGGTLNITQNAKIAYADQGESSVDLIIKGTVNMSGVLNNVGPSIASAIQGGNARAKLTLSDGGTMEMSYNRGEIACAIDNSTAHADIIVNDGSVFSMKGGQIACAYNNSSASVDITVNDGGIFNMSGNIACIPGMISDDNSKVTATITVNNGGLFNMEKGSISYANYGVANVDVIVSDGSVFNMVEGGIANSTSSSANIIINKDSVFNMESGSMAMYYADSFCITLNEGSIFNMKNGTIGGLGVTASVKLTDGSQFNMDGGIISSSACEVTIDINKDSCFSMQKNASIARGTIGYLEASAIINVNDGGTFELGNGSISHAYASSNSSDATQASIVIDNGGVFIMDGGYIAHTYSEFREQTGYTDPGFTAQLNSTATITVKDGGVFNMSGGAISYVDYAPIKNVWYQHFYYALSSVTYAEITIQGDGIFNMSNGSIGEYNLVSSSGRKYSESSASILLVDGGAFNMHGGSMGVVKIAADGGSFNMYDGSIKDAEITISESGSFNMYDGSIKDAEISIDESGSFIMQAGFIEEGKILLNDEGNFEMYNGTIATYGGEFELVVSGESSFSLHNGTINGREIIIEDGTFNMNGGHIYCGRSASITVSHGTFNMNGGDIYCGSSASIMVSHGTFNMNSGMMECKEVEITLNDGGVFNMGYGTIDLSYSIITINDGGAFNVNNGILEMGGGSVTINDGGSFHLDNGFINGTIKVNKGGSFYMDAGFINYANIDLEEGGHFYTDSGSIDRMVLTLNENSVFNLGICTASGKVIVKDRSEFHMDSGTLAYADNDMDYGWLSIDIDSGGKFYMDNGTIAWARDNGEAKAEIHIRDAFTINGGTIAYAENGGNVSASINTSEGINMSGGVIAYAENGGNVSASISASEDMNMSGGVIAYAENGGNVSASIYASKDMNMSGGIIAYAEGDAKAHADIYVDSYYMHDGYIAKGAGASANIYLNYEDTFHYIGGNIGKGATFFLSDDSSLDLTGRELNCDIVMSGGSLKNASHFIGNIYVEYMGKYLDFGGVNAKYVIVFRTPGAFGPNVRGFKGLMEDSELTLNNDMALCVHSEHISYGENHTASRAIIEFNGNGGNVNIDGAIITLTLEADDFFREVQHNNHPYFEIWVTNGTILGEIEDFVFGSGWDNYVEIEKLDSLIDGKLTVKFNFDDVWFAEEHVTTDGTIKDSGFMPWGGYGKVVVNKDTHLTISDNIQLNYLEGSSDLTIDGKGDVILRNEKADTYFSGNMTISSGSLIKTGAGSFEMVGALIADKVKVKEGDFLFYMHSESYVGEIEGKVVVDGKLELTKSSPLAEIINHYHVRLSGLESGEMVLKSLDMITLPNWLGASLHLRAGGTSDTAQAGANVRVLGDMIFRDNTTTTLTLNMNSSELWDSASALSLSADGHIFIEKGAQFVLNALQEALPEGHVESLVNVTVMSGQTIHLVDTFTEEMLTLALLDDAENGATIDVTLSGLFDLYYSGASLTLQDNELLLNAALKEEYVDNGGIDGDENNSGQGSEGQEEGGQGGSQGGIGGSQGGSGDYGDHAPKLGFFEQAAVDSGNSSTAQAAGGMLDSVNLLTTDATLIGLGNALVDMINDGNTAQAEKTMAAVAGNTVTALGAAQRDALRGQLMRMREHAAQAYYYAPREKKLHTWIEATANYADVSTSEDESGYKLNSWGGRVGVDYAANEKLTLGLSLTAMYGDLTAEAADKAEGKLDSYYLSAWLRSKGTRWGHTFLVMASTSDATLDRTVSYGVGSYSTQGSTSGSGYGAMYELTYDVPLSEKSFIQPLVSVSMLSTTMDAYEEKGAEGAGLAVGEQQQVVTSVAIGARWVRKGGENAFGRTASIELSGRVVQDMGDTRSEADNALLANPSYTRTVQGAEVGSTAVQLGAGISVPVGKRTQVYVNGNADIRSGSTSWNVNGGLYLSF